MSATVNMLKTWFTFKYKKGKSWEANEYVVAVPDLGSSKLTNSGIVRKSTYIPSDEFTTDH